MNIELIENFISKEIRPHFSQHEGNIEIISHENKVLKFKFTGKCSNCPSATSETEEFVAKKLKEEFPEIEDVVLVTGVSDELIDFAKSFLNKGL
ncbi:NifU family protein [Fusobacterium sp. PH5-44]|uniref:NifU family protein n=1 Tax=unclassified Fusobacterium TaxID=2648384 RepID=UPI003D1DB71A